MNVPVRRSSRKSKSSNEMEVEIPVSEKVVSSSQQSSDPVIRTVERSSRWPDWRSFHFVNWQFEEVTGKPMANCKHCGNDSFLKGHMRLGLPLYSNFSRHLKNSHNICVRKETRNSTLSIAENQRKKMKAASLPTVLSKPSFKSNLARGKQKKKPKVSWDSWKSEYFKNWFLDGKTPPMACCKLCDTGTFIVGSIVRRSKGRHHASYLKFKRHLSCCHKIEIPVRKKKEPSSKRKVSDEEPKNFSKPKDHVTESTKQPTLDHYEEQQQHQFMDPPKQLQPTQPHIVEHSDDPMDPAPPQPEQQEQESLPPDQNHLMEQPAQLLKDHPKKSELDLNLVQVMCKDIIPIDLLSSDAFRRWIKVHIHTPYICQVESLIEFSFLQLAVPNYNLPLVEKFTDKLLPRAFKDAKLYVHSVLAEAAAVTLVIDVWPSRGMCGCLTFSCSVVSRNFQTGYVFLCMKQLIHDKHFGPALLALIEEVIEEWEISVAKVI